MATSRVRSISAKDEGANNVNQCESCKRDNRKLRSAYCSHCDTTFNADGDTGAAAVCQRCGNASDNFWPDELEKGLCKYCLREAVEDLRPNDEQQPEHLHKGAQEPLPDAPDSSTTGAGGGGEEAEPSQVEISLQDHLSELWRFMGCVCENQVPELFELAKSEWAKKSYYCRDCKQPYSMFLWSTELRKDQCPRCNGAHVSIDKIGIGDEVIRCLNCKSVVSKRRFDSLSKEVQAQCDREKQQKSGPLENACPWCCCTEMRLAVTEFDGNPSVVQICGGCGSTEFLAGWNRASDRLGLGEVACTDPEGQTGSAVPEGFEELTRCCGDLASLHPVEDDPDDDLLVCARCETMVSLRACKDRRVPITVAGLRKALKGTFSSGRMGRPYHTAKVASLDDLKPGDQLDFERRLPLIRTRIYSHHAIVEEPLPNSDEVRIIEYTGESNRPTIAAFLRVLPSKASVQRSLLKFRDKMKEMRRVDYHSLDCFYPRAVLRRAAERIGEEKYSLIESNCEHFSNWAKANVSFSRQVEALKESAKSALRVAVVEITDFMDDLPQDGSLREAVTILQDMRAEMLRVLTKSNGASVRDFWCPIRLLLKWAIRGIPLVLAGLLSKTAGCKIMWNFDALLKPLSEAIVGKVMPTDEGKALKDEAEKKTV